MPDVARMVELVGHGVHPYVAARACGASEDDARDWLTATGRGRGARLARELDAAEAQCEAEAVEILRAAAGKDAKLALAWLERRHRERWASTAVVDLQRELDRVLAAVRAELGDEAYQRVVERLAADARSGATE